jgi:hypothetical protein
MMKLSLLSIGILVALPAAAADIPVGATPPADAVPRVEFAFEERVTISPAVVLGNTALGHRQYIPITGGTVAGPRLKGQVVPGGWDFQHAAIRGLFSESRRRHRDPRAQRRSVLPGWPAQLDASAPGGAQGRTRMADECDVRRVAGRRTGRQSGAYPLLSAQVTGSK